MRSGQLFTTTMYLNDCDQLLVARPSEPDTAASGRSPERRCVQCKNSGSADDEPLQARGVHVNAIRQA
jgi:hypothetical protein